MYVSSSTESQPSFEVKGTSATSKSTAELTQTQHSRYDSNHKMVALVQQYFCISQPMALLPLRSHSLLS